MNDSNREYKKRLSKNGLITLAVAAAILAALILVNLLVSALPNGIKSVDMTENKLYSVSESTKRVVAKTDMKVNLYLISTGGKAALTENGVQLDAFLGNLASVNKKISYSMVDPKVKTEFLTQLGLTAESVSNLSVIVESPLRTRLITASEFYSYYIDGVGKVDETNAMYYYYYYGMTPSYVFDGEALLLGAIQYVTDPELPTMYELSGHSETALTSTLLTQIDTANINAASVTLTGLNALPADCDLLIINAPQSDLSEAEAALLLAYLNDGGSIMLISTPDVASFPNLNTVTAAMGLSASEPGFIVETQSSQYYSAQYPYFLIPAAGTHSLSSASVMLPFAHSITIADNLPTGVTVTPLYTTSSGSYVLPVDAETIEMPEGTETRSHCVAAAAEKSNGAKLIWFSSNGFSTDDMNQVVGGGNYTTFLNAATWVCGQSSSISTTPVSLMSESLTFGTATAGLLVIILVILLPLLFVGYGLFCVIRRKRR